MIVFRVTRPHFPELGRIPGTDYFLDVRRHPTAERYSGTLILGVESSLWFTNADLLRARMRDVEEQTPSLHTVVLDMSGVDHLDATADHALRKIAARCAARDRRLLLVSVDDDVRQVMDASGFTALVGDDAFFANDADAVAHLDAR
jgi:anti-anti-sigma factor